MAETIVNKEHKDRLFTLLFGRNENRAWTLELYNAINGSSYDRPEDIEITTMDDVLYMGMKNDVSYILNEFMNVYEQQSTYNPNMPLRQLMYVGRLYDKYVHRHKLNIYGDSIVKIPIPKLVVFYNGTDRNPDNVKMQYLSDAFISPESENEADISVRVKMLNINYGHNEKLLASCKPLYEYSWFINEIRRNQKEKGYEIETAVDNAIDEMPREYKIRSFLVAHRAEVKMSCLTEYNEAETMELFKEEYLKRGREEGRKEGREEANVNLIKNMLASKTPEEISEFCGFPLELVYKVKEDISINGR